MFDINQKITHTQRSIAQLFFIYLSCELYIINNIGSAVNLKLAINILVRNRQHITNSKGALLICNNPYVIRNAIPRPEENVSFEKHCRIHSLAEPHIRNLALFRRS